MTNKTYTLVLEIDAEAYRSMYAGQARNVVARATNGENVSFPAAALRCFVEHQGIRGVFELEVTSDNRIVELRRKEG